MNNVFGGMVRNVALLNKVLGALSATTSVVIAFFVVYAALARYVFRAPSAYSLELPEVLFIVVTALALGYAQIGGKHVCVEIVTSRLQGFAKDAFGLFARLVTLFYCAIVFWAIWERTTINLARSATTAEQEIPLAPFTIIILIGFVSLILQIIVEIVALISRKTDMLIKEKRE